MGTSRTTFSFYWWNWDVLVALQGLKNVTVTEGESLTLECHIGGRPSPVIMWFREDYQIESSIDFQTSFTDGIARLLIREAFAEDSGRFSCTATNEAGTVSTSCYLLVKGQRPCGGRALHVCVEDLSNLSKTCLRLTLDG